MPVAHLDKNEKLQNEREESSLLMKSAIRNISDTWDASNYCNAKNETAVFHFKSAEKIWRPYLKFYSWSKIFEEGLDPLSVRASLYEIYSFLGYTGDPDDTNESSWTNFVDITRERVRKIGNISKSNTSKAVISTSTAYFKALSIISFLQFLNDLNFYNFSWIGKYRALALFPLDIEKYFSRKELRYMDNAIKESFHEREDRAIPYIDLIEIMPTAYSCENIPLRAVIIIAAHTGLRLIEILHLGINCLEKVAEDEISTAKKYIHLHGGMGGIIPDWSKAYWMSNYLASKTKKSTWTKGTPILVSKVVYDAIEALKLHTEKLRIMHGSDYLFLTEHKGSIKITRRNQINLQRREFIEDENLPYFTIHQFRHTFATILHDEGVPLFLIKKYLNHLTSQATAGYIKCDTERKKETMKSIILQKSSLSQSTHDTSKKIYDAIESITQDKEWSSWAEDDQLELFELVLKKRNLGIVYYDHGKCFLPPGEICPHGYGEVKPCYLADCKDYDPDENELPFFVDLISKREKAIIQMNSIGLKAENHQDIIDDTQTIAGIIEMLKERQNFS